MNCNCEPKKYSIGMGCCVPVLAPIENYYTKHQVDQLIEEIESAITSGCCITPEEVDEKIDAATSGIDQNIDAISGDVITISGDLQAVSAEVESISGLTSGDVQTMIDESVSGKADSDDVYLKNETSSKTEIDSALQEISNEIQSISAVTSGDVITIVAESISGKTDDSDFSAHTANTTVHITSAERTTWNGKPNIWSGTESQWSSISGGTLDNNTIYLVY